MTPIPNKPPYTIPTMAEIAAIPWNGRYVVSTFAGCGGSSLGYRMAGYRVLFANEFIPAAAETYEANKAPYTVVDRRDVRALTAADILAATGGIVPDVLDGSPPCASFSTAGKRNAHWGQIKDYSDTKQRTDDLFFEYARLLGELRPLAFVAENVSELVKGVAKGYFKEILAALQAAGYVVKAALLDAQWLGVPQMRQRIIFVGLRADLGLTPKHPTPLGYRYSVRDALAHVRRVELAGPGFVPSWRSADEPSPTIVQSGNSSFKQSPYTLVEADIAVQTKHGIRSADEPAPTIQTHNSPHTFSEMTLIERARDDAAAESPRYYRDNRGAFGSGGEISEQLSPTVLAESVGTHWVEEPQPTPDRLVLGAHGYYPGETIELATEPAPTILASGLASYRYHVETDAQPQSAASVEPTLGVFGGSRSLDAPAPTIQTHGRPNTRNELTLAAPQTERRKFTIAELKRICAFPDDFILTGTYAQQWERLGRAVPPLMMRAVALTLAETLAPLPLSTPQE